MTRPETAVNDSTAPPAAKALTFDDRLEEAEKQAAALTAGCRTRAEREEKIREIAKTDVTLAAMIRGRLARA